MNFFISNKKELPDKFGKWYYYHDTGCRTIKHDGKLTIYHGYVIDSTKTIEDHIKLGTLMNNNNGNFFAVTISRDKVEVFVDYFSQHKIFYRDDGNRLEVTNKIYFFPLKHTDIDHKKLYDTKQHALMKNHLPLDHDTVDQMERYRRRRGKGKEYATPLFLTRGNRHTDTVFKNIFILATYHTLELTERSKETERVDLVSKNYNSLFGDQKETNNQKIEDQIYSCMLEHSNIIKKTYESIVSSVSDGVDSVLQDCFFPEARKLTYTYDPPATSDEFKHDYLDRFPKEMTDWQTFEVSRQNEIAKELANDPEADFFDTLPTTWQIKNYQGKIDVLLYGQMGDNVFLHHPWYAYTFIIAELLKNNDVSVEQKLNLYHNETEKIKNCYSARETLGGPQYHTYNKLYNIKTVDDLQNTISVIGTDWQKNVAQAIVPSTYTRDLIHSCDLPVVSLYADKRFFNLIHSASENILRENIRDARTQKNILRNKFNYEFKTPCKDGAYFNMHKMSSVWHKYTVKYCLDDHLPEQPKEKND